MSTNFSEVSQAAIEADLPCAEHLSEQELAEFIVTIAGKAVQRLWRNWDDRLKRVTLNAVKWQILGLYQQLEAMLWTILDGYLFF